MSCVVNQEILKLFIGKACISRNIKFARKLYVISNTFLNCLSSPSRFLNLMCHFFYPPPVLLKDNSTYNWYNSHSWTSPSRSLQSSHCRWTNTIAGKPYASFQGVRYAQPPLGELRLIFFIGSYVPQRFRNPQPFLSGEILYDVSGESTVQCPQFGGVWIEEETN